MKDDDDDEFEDVDFTPKERRRLRRMILDDQYARRFKTTVKVWLITFGTVGTMAAAAMTVWREIAMRFVK